VLLSPDLAGTDELVHLSRQRMSPWVEKSVAPDLVHQRGEPPAGGSRPCSRSPSRYETRVRDRQDRRAELAKMCQRQYGINVAQPTNLYGPHDSLSWSRATSWPPVSGRSMGATLTGSPSVEVWGWARQGGSSDMRTTWPMPPPSLWCTPGARQVGVGEDLSIRELAELIPEVIGWRGDFRFDTSMPDGTPRTLLDVSGLEALGWGASIGLREGIRHSYECTRRTSPGEPLRIFEASPGPV
jgi:hypothetical protein